MGCMQILHLEIHAECATLQFLIRLYQVTVVIYLNSCANTK